MEGGEVVLERHYRSQASWPGSTPVIFVLGTLEMLICAHGSRAEWFLELADAPIGKKLDKSHLLPIWRMRVPGGVISATDIDRVLPGPRLPIENAEGGDGGVVLLLHITLPDLLEQDHLQQI